MLLQVIKYCFDFFFDCLNIGIQRDLSISRRLVRVINTGKVFNLTGARFFVQPFWIALFSTFQRTINMHFDKIVATVFMQFDRGQRDKG